MYFDSDLDLQPLVVPKVAAEEVAVWSFAIDIVASDLNLHWRVLHESERSRALRFRSRADRNRFVTTRAVLRRLLAGILGYQPRDLEFVTGPYGKPRLMQGKDQRAGLEFSVAHAGPLGLIAISEGQTVGIDTEQHRFNFLSDEMLLLILSTREQVRPLDRCIGHFERWVAKEAVLKCLGFGLSAGMQSVSILARDAGHRAEYVVEFDSADWPPTRACPIRVGAGVSAALAWRPRVSPEAFGGPLARHDIVTRVRAAQRGQAS